MHAKKPIGGADGLGKMWRVGRFGQATDLSRRALRANQKRSNGRGWIRTNEGISQQIYSLSRLSTSVRARMGAECRSVIPRRPLAPSWRSASSLSPCGVSGEPIDPARRLHGRDRVRELLHTDPLLLCARPLKQRPESSQRALNQAGSYWVVKTSLKAGHTRRGANVGRSQPAEATSRRARACCQSAAAAGRERAGGRRGGRVDLQSSFAAVLSGPRSGARIAPDLRLCRVVDRRAAGVKPRLGTNVR